MKKVKKIDIGLGHVSATRAICAKERSLLQSLITSDFLEPIR